MVLSEKMKIKNDKSSRPLKFWGENAENGLSVVAFSTVHGMARWTWQLQLLSPFCFRKFPSLTWFDLHFHWGPLFVCCWPSSVNFSSPPVCTWESCYPIEWYFTHNIPFVFCEIQFRFVPFKIKARHPRLQIKMPLRSSILLKGQGLN